jgi:hypothetical protein
MFSKKYNPDIINTYNDNLSNRKNNNFELKNTPYKLIINEQNKNIRTGDDLKINIDNNKDNVIKNYNSILEERKIKQKLIKKNISDNDLKLDNINLDNEEYIEDYIDIKENFESEFKDTEDEIKKDRDKFNNILESLLSDGLLD